MSTTGPDVAVPQLATKQGPQLRPDQMDQVFAAGREFLCATLCGRPPSLSDPKLAGAGDRVVSGAFVSLKRGKHLRSCCGMLGQRIPLLQALQQAADRTAWEDMRFPPVSPGELEHLDMEVWVLYTPEPVVAQGEDRIAAVTVGRHGLSIARGQAHGLLLPGVATENRWDARTFLEHVCFKAGLHPTAWKDAATALFTFEGDSIRGPVGSLGHGPAETPLPVSAEDLPAYADFCLQNIAAFLSGATPSYYLFGRADGQVSGVALTVRRRGDAQGLTFSQMSLRPGLPLQSTLFGLAQSAAQQLERQQITAEAFQSLEASLAVFFDPALHGTVADPDLAGADRGRRGLYVVERSRSAIVFDRARPPAQALAEAARQAQVRRPAAAAVFTLATLATDERLTIASVPRPVRGPAVRPPGVAGKFYPGEPGELDRVVTGLLGDIRRPEPWPAAMVPHAGLVFSGHIAAGVFNRLRIPRTVIVIGPKHTNLGMDWAIAPHQTWSLPGFTVESDFLLARRLAEAIPGLAMDSLAHQNEHAVEVELPFIARLAPQARVVGIAIGEGDLDGCRRFAAGLADVLRRQEERPLLVISSDMNHFATDAENRRLDEIAVRALERLDPADVYETVTANNISMCGLLPAVIVLETLCLLGGARTAERVGYATSADVTGDPSRVVGYAGMLFR